MEFTEGLTGFDWVVIAIVGLMAIAGLMRGFTQELISLAGWVAAALAVRFFHEVTTLWLLPKVGAEASAAVIAFLILFFGTLILSRVAAGMIGGISRGSLLGPLDRILGMGFGAFKGLILVSAVFLLAEFSTGLFDEQRQSPEWLMESRSAPLLSMSAEAMVGWVRDFREGGGEPSADDTYASAPTLPDNHPPFDAQDYYPPEQGGYNADDRRALDELLNEGAKSGEQVAI